MTYAENEQEELRAEYSGRHDYTREAFASTELDGYYEGYCDYEGPLSFNEFVADVKEKENGRQHWNEAVEAVVTLDDNDEIPF